VVGARALQPIISRALYPRQGNPGHCAIMQPCICKHKAITQPSSKNFADWYLRYQISVLVGGTILTEMFAANDWKSCSKCMAHKIELFYNWRFWHQRKFGRELESHNAYGTVTQFSTVFKKAENVKNT
jgi:hypothetical protein